MAIDLGSVALKVTPDLANFRPELDKGISQSMKRIGGTMQKTGAIATGVITAPILAGFSKATKAASSLNESVNAVNVVFGDAAGKVHDFARVAAGEAGLSMRAFNAAAVPIGAVLQNVGFSADDAADASISLAKRAADLASVYDTDLDTALAAIQSGLRGQMEPLTQFGGGMTAAEVDAHALEMGLAGTAGELDENAKMQARLSLLMQRTDKVSGDFKNTIGDVANAERNVAAEAENAAAKFGEKLLPAKLKLTQIGGSLVDRFNNLSPSMQNSAVAAGAVAAAAGPAAFALGTVLKATGNIIEHGPKVVGAFGNAGKAVGGFAKTSLTSAGNVAKAGATMVASAVKSTASVLANIARQTAAWVMLGARATAQGARVAAAWTASAITAAVKATASTVAQAARVVAAWVLMATRATANAARVVAGWAATAAAAIAATATHAGQVAVQAARWAFLGVQSLLHAAKVAAAWLIAMGPIAIVTAAVVGLVVLIVRNWETIRRVIATGWQAVKDTTVRLWTAAKDFVRDRITDMVIFVTLLPERAKAGLVSTWQTLWGHWKRVFNSIRDAVKGRVDAVVNFFKGLPGRIVKALGNVAKKIKDKFTFDLPDIKIPFIGGDGPGGSRGGTALATVRNAMQGISGLYVTSTYRTPAQNRRVGGSPTSFHLDKTNPAVDVGGSMVALDKLHARLARVGGRELLWRTKGHWDHLHYAHEGGFVSPQGIEPLRRNELDTRLQYGETVLPADWRGSRGGDLIAEVRGLREDVNGVRAEVHDVRAEVRRQTDHNLIMTRTR